MANVIFPRSWADRKPGLGVGIDSNHPLGQGLIRTLLLNEQNLAPRFIPPAPAALVVNGTPSAFMGRQGYGILCSNLSNDLLSWNFADLNGCGPAAGGKPFSIVIGISDWSGFPDGTFFSKTTSTSSTGDKVLITSGQGISHDITFAYRTSTDGLINCSSGVAFADSLAHIAVAVFDPSASGAQLAIYVDGHKLNTASVNGFQNLATLDRTAFGGEIYNTGVAGIGRSPIHFAHIYKRALAAGEVGWLQVEPYAMMQRPAKPARFFIAPPAAVGAGLIRFPTRWTRKPPPSTNINWSHPLARGLVLCFPCNEGGGFPVENIKGNPCVLGPSGAVVWTPGGLGTGPSPTATAINYTATDPLNGLSDFTIFSIFELRVARASVTTSSAIAFGKWGTTVATQNIMVRINSTTQTRFDAHLGTTNSSVIATDSFVPGINTVAARLTASKGELFGNGVLLTGSSQGTGALVTNGIGFYIYCGANSLVPLTPNIGHGCFVWNRPLQASEIAWLHAEPYALFRGPRTVTRLFASASSSSLVASAITGFYESLKAIARVDGGNYEALKGIAHVDGGNYEALKGIAKSNAGNYEALGGIAKSNAGNYEALKAIARPIGGNYESLAAVAKAITGNYEALKGIAAAIAANYEALKGLAAGQTGNYEAIGKVAAPSGGNYESLAPVAKSTGGNYEALKGVAAADAGNYESLGNAKAPVTGNYESLGAIAKANAGNYEALSAVAKSLQGNYEALKGIFGSQSGFYEALSAAGVISSSVTGFYESLAPVVRPIGGNYEALKGISVQVPGFYESLRGIAKAAQSFYESLQPIVSSKSGNYESLAPLKKAITGAYEVLQGIRAAQGGNYEALSSGIVPLPLVVAGVKIIQALQIASAEVVQAIATTDVQVVQSIVTSGVIIEE